MTGSNLDERLAADQDRLDRPAAGGTASSVAVLGDGDVERAAAVPMVPSAPLGLIGLHELAPHLTAAGFEVIADPDLKTTAQLLQGAVRIWQEEAGEQDRLPVLILNTPRVAGLVPRIQRHVDLTLLGTVGCPVADAEGHRSYQLPGSVRDILKNADIDGYEAVPDHLELDPEGRLLDPERGWDDWEPEPALAEAGDSAPVATEVPAEAADLGDVVFGVSRSSRRSLGAAGRAGLGQVVISLSGSGGVGKSTFSLALAARAAERGQRVVLVDGNLGQGDLAAFLRVSGAGLPTMFDAVVDGRNLARSLLTPTRLSDTRAAGLPKVGFALLQAPSLEELRTGRVTPAVVYDLVEEARRIADLVVVDTQIVESDDPRRVLADLILPQLGRGGWAVAITGLSTAGLANLNRLLAELEAEGVNGARVLSLLSRMPVGVDVDHDRLVQTLRERSAYLGTAFVDDGMQQALNRGDTLVHQPALANLVDTVLNRLFDLPVIAPAHQPDQSAEPRRSLRSRWLGRLRSA